MDLREQLLDAFERSGMSLVALRDKARLRGRRGAPLSTVSLGRKLRGLQTLRAGECEALAGALVVTASTGQVGRRPKRRAA